MTSLLQADDSARVDPDWQSCLSYLLDNNAAHFSTTFIEKDPKVLYKLHLGNTVTPVLLPDSCLIACSKTTYILGPGEEL